MKFTTLFYFILLTPFLSAQSFTEVPPQHPFVGVEYGSIAFSDVDGDNDLDVLVTGYGNSNTEIAKLYTNDGMGNFSEKTGTPFDGVEVGSIAFSDIDGDNDQDVLITGHAGSNTAIAKLYLNDGMGNFTEKVGTPFVGVSGSSIAFSDVDGDNDPDVFIAGGVNSSTLFTKLYTNDGMGNFSEKTGTPFVGVVSSSIAFSDIDGDNDPDVLITGYDGSFTRTSKLYTNDGLGNFTEKTGTPFDGVARSSIAFSDVDGDNDQDVLITGEGGSTPVSKLYLNDGMGNFSEKTGTPFVGAERSSIDFSDVNGDNDPDILITGKNNVGTRISKLYLNDGMGNFTEKTGTPFDGVDDGSIAFSDIDGDNDPDVLITGSTGVSTQIAKLYTNDGTGNFSEKTGTPFDGVYESSIAFSDVDGDNDPDVLITGTSSSALTSKLYLNDGMGNFTEKTGTPFDGVRTGSIAFSDVDGDNDPDVLITGSNNGFNEISKLYLNDGMGNFSEKTGTPFEGVIGSSIAFSDVDGDNDPDVLITGRDSSLTGTSKLYLNDGMGNFSEKTGAPFDGVFFSSIAFSDVDGDMDPDVLITGYDGANGIAKLYANDGVGNFSEKTGTPFEGIHSGSIAFSDVDGDNDQDVLITGRDVSATRISKLYLNDGMGNFTEKTGTPFSGVSISSIAFSDVEGDNDQDVLITGSDVSATRISKLYTNDGSGNFTEVMGTPFDGVDDGSIAFADVDGDTDQDILITGDAGTSRIARLYTNDRIGTSIDYPGSARDNNILLYPNPSMMGEVYIDYPTDKNNILEISLISIEGRICFQQYSPVRHGLNNITVRYPALQSGWYIIKLDDGIRSRYVKLVVE